MYLPKSGGFPEPSVRRQNPLFKCGTCLLAPTGVVQIVELLNMIYCMAELLEFAAFIWLRIK